ncbi:MAG: flavin reductase family protein [Chloroflexota bacterium]|nr:flavin reductase family protein [Chloroflexota bacterium]
MAIVDEGAFKAAAGSFASGVTVVTTKHEGKVHGMTVSAFASLSLDPMQIMVSLRTGSRLQGMIEESKIFGVSILREDQKAIASHFATRGLDLQDGVFPQFPSDEHVTGSPIFQDAIAYFDCNVFTAYECGDHILFVGDVLAAGSNEGQPLGYYKGNYRSITDLTGG